MVKPAWKRSCTEYARAPVSIDYEDASGGAAVVYRAHVEELEDGAKLILVPKSARRQLLDSLRVQVQQETLTMRRRGCGRGQEAL
jgi:hypothetical protein